MEANQSIKAIHAVDNRLAAIQIEREALQAKRQQAEDAREPVSLAQAEIQDAKEALEEKQSDAFISGIDVDLTPFASRVTKAETKLAEVNKTAAAARAAIPRIAAKIKDLDEEKAGLLRDRNLHTQQYFRGLQQAEADVYLKHAEGLIASIVKLRALDRRTGESLGHDLQMGFFSNWCFRVPKEGRYAVDIDFRAFEEPHVDAALACIDAIFESSTRGKVKGQI